MRPATRFAQIPAVIFLIFAALLNLSPPAFAEAACNVMRFDSQNYSVCRSGGEGLSLALFNLDKSGKPYRYLFNLQRALILEGKSLRFAMNAGMFNDRGLPIGLYIENGKQAKKLNRRNGAGNFHLKPNGVFFIKGGKPGVMETEAFAKSGLKPDFASQSGPMLVIDGRIHPKIQASGTSRKLRNGVGIDADGNAVFAISEGAVTFHEFARLFRDRLGCHSALYFDGSVSSLYAPELGRNDNFLPLGPMVGAFEKE